MSGAIMDIVVISILLLSACILPGTKAKPQEEDARRFDDRNHDLERRFPFDAQDRLSNRNDEISNKNDELESRSLALLGFGGLGRHPGNNLGGLLGSLGGFPTSQSSNGFTGQNINQNLGGLLGSLGAFPESQSSNGIPGQNINRRFDQGLFRGLPGPLNSLLGSQNLVGAASGGIRSNPNLLGGQSGLIRSFPGLGVGNNGLGNNSPANLLTGRSPIADILAMASFLTSDELKDMFSEDKSFNFIPVIQQNTNKQQEDQDVQQFIRFLNSKTENEKESLGSSANTGFEKRDQRSLSTNPILAQQIRSNALQQRLAQQNQLQSALLRNAQLQQSLQASQNSRYSSPQSQIQSSPNNIFADPLRHREQGQSNQQANSFGFSPLQLQGQSNQQDNGFGFNQLLLQGQGNPLLSQGQSNQQPNGFGFSPLLMQQALLQNAQRQQLFATQQQQQPQLQALQQLLLQQSKVSGRYGRSEQEISASLPFEHKQEPFRFPNE